MKTTASIAIGLAIVTFGFSGTAYAGPSAPNSDDFALPVLPYDVGDDAAFAVLSKEVQVTQDWCRVSSDGEQCTCNCFWDGCSEYCPGGYAMCYCKWGVCHDSCHYAELLALMEAPSLAEVDAASWVL